MAAASSSKTENLGDVTNGSRKRKRRSSDYIVNYFGVNFSAVFLLSASIRDLGLSTPQQTIATFKHFVILQGTVRLRLGGKRSAILYFNN